MKTQTMNVTKPQTGLSGVLAASLAAAALLNVHLALGMSDRAAFYALFVAGFALCSGGIIQATVHGWTHPLTLFGCAFGAAALLFAAAVWFEWPLPGIAGDRGALAALAIAMLVKVAAAQLYPRRASATR